MGNSVKEQFAYEKIYSELLNAILSGELPAGSMLPPETQLAEQYGVSRITSRRALNMLAQGGYVVRHPGKGTQVVEEPKKVKTIGLVLATFGELFGTGFVKGVFRGAGQKGYLVIMQTDYFLGTHEEKRIQELLTAGVKGIINVPLYESGRYNEFYETLTQKLPVVFADRELVGMDVPVICTDNMASTKMLCYKLYELGHRNIAFVSSNSKSTAVQERLYGYREFCGTVGIPEKGRVEYTKVRSVLPGMHRDDVAKWDIEELCILLKEKRHITAIVAHTHEVALLVCEAIRRLGKTVPEDYSVACFDSPDSTAQRSQFSHIRQDELTMGMKAVECLIKMIEGQPVEQKTYVSGIYVDGNSTGKPRF